MKVHYISILLFTILLNILLLSSQVYNQRNHKSTTHHTPKIPTTRSLCECELYAPATYDDDPQMKEVMQQFEDRTSQRFHEYDERMKTTRQKCREQCDKEIQKIILKDKLEKELMDKFATLQTDIQNDAIPTCVCEKSLEDKMEKACLRCTQNLGGIVAPSTGVLLGIAEGALYAWKPKALEAAIAAAKEAGAAAGEAARIKAGIEAVILGIKSKFPIHTLNFEALESVIIAQKYNDVSLISGFIEAEYYESGCRDFFSSMNIPICKSLYERIFDTSEGVQRSFSPKDFIKTNVEEAVAEATAAAEAKKTEMTSTMTATFTTEKTGVVQSTYMSYQTPIIASIVAIVVIVLIMVIIYLILRYRRKRKMKKKLQYIKLLEE
ncbi:hypothetical protein PFBG_05949 [Plasmodium falciparum 7G8]|uniref:Rifin n=1 Tax=Plasmodium falciparum (isolate 7G8) TaxID=57266 RepID=W7FCV7_PLAF8|nr:hypothetical protein PFBG_05949 [Plasmodium falciparum 7G8]